MRIAASVGLVLLSAQVASADIVRAPQAWRVDPAPFRQADGNKNKANEELSGAACATGTNRCLVVNDEGRFAQFFEINGTTIAPKEVIGLLPPKIGGKTMKELDAEAADYVAPRAGAVGASGYFYVTGSHGASRKGKAQPSRSFVLRFPVDPATGHPTFAFDAEDAAPQIERSAALRAALAKLPEVGSFAERRLDENGVTVEGFAVLGQEALFGLRGPCIAGHAFVVRTPLEAVFSGAPVTATTSRLALGDNVGIRDLARVQGGVLILSGRSNDTRGKAAFNCEKPGVAPEPGAQVWFWSGKDGDAARNLGTLPGLPATHKAETLLVLGEDAARYRVLVWFDGVPDGDPTEFFIGK